MNGSSIDIVIATLVATTVVLILSSFAVIFTIIYKKKQQAYISEKQILHTRFQEELLHSQLEIKEQTLQHISHELHDNFGQIASLIKINLNTLQLNNSLDSQQKIEDTKQLTRKLISDLKSLSLNLNTDRIAHIGLLKNIEADIAIINRTGQFNAQYSHEGQVPELDPNVAIIMYRISQEILNNAIKHSSARLISVTIQTSANFFKLTCFDDGSGFDLEDKKSSSGLGLLHLQSRAKLINAKLTIHSVPTQGTTVLVELPI